MFGEIGIGHATGSRQDQNGVCRSGHEIGKIGLLDRIRNSFRHGHARNRSRLRETLTGSEAKAVIDHG